MEKEKRNRLIIVFVVILLLLVVIAFIIYSIFNKNNNNKKLVNVTINQVYSSDYNLESFDVSYFIGTYEENLIGVIINGDGQEVFNGVEDFKYDAVFPMKDERYLIYSNADNKFITYIFDGVDIKKFYEINDVSYVKPIIYKGIDSEYIIGFASMVGDDLYLYNLNSSGILVVNDTSLVADYNDNGVYYTYNENYLVVKNNDDLMGVINLDGEIIIDFKYKNIINTYHDSFVVLNKKDKYGVINKNNEVLLKINYKAVDFYKDYYLVVNSKNKMALYGTDYKKITDFEMNYDSLIEYDLRSECNSINLYKVDGKVIVVNNYLEDKSGIEYDKHNLYIIDNGKIIKKINQVGFGNDDVVYTYNKDYEVTIYDNQFQLLFEFKLDNIKKIDNISYISTNAVKVSYFTLDEKVKTVYYDLDGNEVDFGLGELIIKNVDYYGYIKAEDKKQKLTLYDLEGNYLDDIYGDNIEVFGDYLIVDKSIYKIELKEN